MKRIAALAVAVVFFACMMHFFYAEDHCLVHHPAPSGQPGHVPAAHPGASTCLCFMGSILVTEPAEFIQTQAFVFMTAPDGIVRPPDPVDTDIPHPPRASFL
ncbi:MAG: hypothetical protein ACYDH0_03575 [Candidatus Aminicenantales bacterium]